MLRFCAIGYLTMFIESFTAANTFAATIAVLETWRGILDLIYSYLTKRYYIANDKIVVSVATLVEGAAIFAVAVLLSRVLSALLQRRIARHTYLDQGIQYTLGRLTQYLIMAVGILMALTVGIGLNLTSLAVVFTALSVGIGFGLQYIAADIASGFILLFERPVRVGDRISIDKQEGDVQSINLRTTVLMTNDRVSVIVPNSKLVRGELVNWSYGDPRARISIPIGVATEADVDLVTATLLRAAEDIDNVLKDPPAKVQFLEFADWSNNFRLLVWTNRPRLHRQIRSDINYKIQKFFTEAGIEIPYPQTEVRLRKGAIHIDGGDDLRAIQESSSED